MKQRFYDTDRLCGESNRRRLFIAVYVSSILVNIHYFSHADRMELTYLSGLTEKPSFFY